MKSHVYTKKRQPRIVTIGGGTGQHTLLKGLKVLPIEITALVSMADDGASTGVLRDEMGVLPPGDVRNCIAALSDESTLVRTLFSYRFAEGPAVGHAFGNLFLSALEKITGNFTAAVEEASRLLSVRGTILPISVGDMRLVIELKNGTAIVGEKHLDSHPEIRTVGIDRVLLATRVQAHPQALAAISRADMIVIGPGDLYGSIVPPLLVDGVGETLSLFRGPIVYVANLTNKKGQTDTFTVDDYLEKIERVIGKNVITHVLGNSAEPQSHLKKRYEAHNDAGSIVTLSRRIEKRGSVVYIGAPIVSDDDFSVGGAHASFIRHDSKKLARALMHILRKT